MALVADFAAAAAPFRQEAVSTDGAVSIGGKRISYTATAGTLVVYPADHDDVPQDHVAERDSSDPTEASMFYVVYARKGVRPELRPITFVFNGGPGSASVWLHMGAFGPRRVTIAHAGHTPAAPYATVENDQSLLDVSDLVFVDAPGTGYSRVAGANKVKSFFGVDQDAHAFAEFISGFLSVYGRWNSPKYVLGESYGTTRAAVLANLLQRQYAIDLNGVILLSQILTLDGSPDGPDANPSVDIAYPLALPSYAAAAWYHHRLPAAGKPPASAADLPAYLAQVEAFALGDYAAVLAAGAGATGEQRARIAEQLHLYTGLSVDYILKADLRVGGADFSKALQDDADITVGRLDTRVTGPSMDPLSKRAAYDPQGTSTRPAYEAAFGDYIRRTLKYDGGGNYRMNMPPVYWDFAHRLPGRAKPSRRAPNALPDIAAALKRDPLLRIQLNQGYYDLATPFLQGIYEMRHMPIPASLQGNIEFRQYASGHMIYADVAALRDLHENIAAFIDQAGRPDATTSQDRKAN